MKVLVLGVLLLQILDSQAFIIPDELPSILSVIYSNIPTIKKGTDSRLGWGFRLGDRADFQFLVELGPQTNTQPLANQGDGSGSNKRNALNNLANTLYAQRQQEKKTKERGANKKVKEDEQATASNADGAEWLKNWSKSVQDSQENEALPLRPKPGLGVGEIDAKSVIPDDSVLLKQEEKKRKGGGIKVVVSSEETAFTTSKEDAPHNANLKE